MSCQAGLQRHWKPSLSQTEHLVLGMDIGLLGQCRSGTVCLKHILLWLHLLVTVQSPRHQPRGSTHVGNLRLIIGDSSNLDLPGCLLEEAGLPDQLDFSSCRHRNSVHYYHFVLKWFTSILHFYIFLCFLILCSLLTSVKVSMNHFIPELCFVWPDLSFDQGNMI